jgi:hypothetical protein
MNENGLLKEVQNEQARAKIGAFGIQGSGKTTTLALLAIATSVSFHKKAPVAMMDTENGSDFLKPMFDAEGIKLYVHKSGAFADMAKVLLEAEKLGCCAFLMDSVTHTWRELQDTYCAQMCRRHNLESYEMQFQDWREVKAQWATWTYAFINSPLHCFVAGRAGYDYEYEKNAKGKRELIKGNSKMKAENEFGYEPSLLIELEPERRNTTKKHRGGSIVHMAYVLKDRSRALNGKVFEFPDMNAYAKGDYKTVFETFRPHFSFLNIAGEQLAILPNTSEELFDTANGSSEASQRAKSKKIALEEIENSMGVVLWPGNDANMKRIKLAALQLLFGVRSWTAVETMPLRTIENGLWALQEYERAAKDAQPEGEEAVTKLLRECKAKVEKSGYVPGGEPLTEAASATAASD